MSSELQTAIDRLQPGQRMWGVVAHSVTAVEVCAWYGALLDAGQIDGISTAVDDGSEVMPYAEEVNDSAEGYSRTGFDRNVMLAGFMAQLLLDPASAGSQRFNIAYIVTRPHGSETPLEILSAYPSPDKGPVAVA